MRHNSLNNKQITNLYLRQFRNTQLSRKYFSHLLISIDDIHK